jgi:hypothetical protein
MRKEEEKQEKSVAKGGDVSATKGTPAAAANPLSTFLGFFKGGSKGNDTVTL